MQNFQKFEKETKKIIEEHKIAPAYNSISREYGIFSNCPYYKENWDILKVPYVEIRRDEDFEPIGLEVWWSIGEGGRKKRDYIDLKENISFQDLSLYLFKKDLLSAVYNCAKEIRRTGEGNREFIYNALMEGIKEMIENNNKKAGCNLANLLNEISKLKGDDKEEKEFIEILKDNIL